MVARDRKDFACFVMVIDLEGTHYSRAVVWCSVATRVQYSESNHLHQHDLLVVEVDATWRRACLAADTSANTWKAQIDDHTFLPHSRLSPLERQSHLPVSLRALHSHRQLDGTPDGLHGSPRRGSTSHLSSGPDPAVEVRAGSEHRTTLLLTNRPAATPHSIWRWDM